MYSQKSSTSEAEQATPREESPAEDTLVFVTEGDTDIAVANGEIDAFGIWDLLRMVLVLLMVVGAIYGVISLLRRRVKPTGVDDETSPIRVLASKVVGEHEIHAVMIGRRVLVLAGGSSGLELITQVEDQETIDELVLAHSAASRTQQRGRTFGSILAGWFGNLAVPGTRDGRSVADRPAEFHDGTALFNGQSGRLRKLR